MMATARAVPMAWLMSKSTATQRDSSASRRLSRPSGASEAAIRLPMLSPPNTPVRMPIEVMPTCTVDRKRSGCSDNARAARARRLVLAFGLRRDRRAVSWDAAGGAGPASGLGRLLEAGPGGGEHGHLRQGEGAVDQDQQQDDDDFQGHGRRRRPDGILGVGGTGLELCHRPRPGPKAARQGPRVVTYAPFSAAGPRARPLQEPTMFSLQTIFGKGDKFYGLLEASAAAARESARALGELLATPPAQRSLERFKEARQREKDLFAQINEELVNTFVTALEREDIEALSNALYKIPKVIEKFAERYTLASERVGDVDFISRAAMLERACVVLEEMVALLRKGMDLDTTRRLNDKLQAIETEADRLTLELYRDTYTQEEDPMRYLILKDLFEILEKAIDRCRDAGNVIYHVVLKNA